MDPILNLEECLTKQDMRQTVHPRELHAGFDQTGTTRSIPSPHG